MARITYFIRAEPWDHRVPPGLRQQLFEELAHRFDPSLRDEWDAIHVTSIPADRGSAEANEQMHRRLREILEHAEPDWESHFRIVPYADAWSERSR